MTDQNQRVDLTGRVLMNKLRVERLLGEGGMGVLIIQLNPLWLISFFNH